MIEKGLLEREFSVPKHPAQRYKRIGKEKLVDAPYYDHQELPKRTLEIPQGAPTQCLLADGTKN